MIAANCFEQVRASVKCPACEEWTIIIETPDRITSYCPACGLTIGYRKAEQ